MFRVNNKNTKKTSLLYDVLNDVIDYISPPFSIVSNIDFEQVKVSWDDFCITEESFN